MQGRERPEKSSRRVFPFRPRIINPVRMKHAVAFSADERIRDSLATLKENMPWLSTAVFSNPAAVADFRPGEPTAYLFDDTAMNIVDAARIRQSVEDAAIILLSSNELVQCSPPSAAIERYPYTAKADLIFGCDKAGCAPERIAPAAVRAAEDLINIKFHSKARRYIFLIVDDEPRWFSQFLPVLYNIIGQRADVMLARTYEQALGFLFGVESESDIDAERFRSRGHGDDVVCLITDIFFPKGGEPDCAAGRDLVRLAARHYPRMPIVVASKTKEAEEFRGVAFVLPKGDPGSLDMLRAHIRDHTGLGEFLITSAEGRELHRIKNLAEMMNVLQLAEEDSARGAELRGILEGFGEKDSFSTWLYMHSFRDLADKLRPKRASGRRLIAVLKRHFRREALRMECTPLVIDNMEIFELEDLLKLLESAHPDRIQKYSDDDVFSSWLDRKGYMELAEELRPIHGAGSKLTKALLTATRRWIDAYRHGQRP